MFLISQYLRFEEVLALSCVSRKIRRLCLLACFRRVSFLMLPITLQHKEQDDDGDVDVEEWNADKGLEGFVQMLESYPGALQGVEELNLAYKNVSARGFACLHRLSCLKKLSASPSRRVRDAEVRMLASCDLGLLVELSLSNVNVCASCLNALLSSLPCLLHLALPSCALSFCSLHLDDGDGISSLHPLAPLAGRSLLSLDISLSCGLLSPLSLISPPPRVASLNFWGLRDGLMDDFARAFASLGGPHVVRLNMGHCPLQLVDGLVPVLVQHCPNLEELVLSLCPHLSRSVQVYLHKLPRLRSLLATSTPLQDFLLL